MNKQQHSLSANPEGSIRCEEEKTLQESMWSLKKEIRELHFSLEDEKEYSENNSKTWKVDRKVEKIDEVLEKYEITLQAELNTINSKYDVKIENLKQEVERKIRELREYESSQIDRIERERQRGLEGKKNEYDSYIAKREQERNSLIKDKNLIVKNLPDKVSNIKRRRLLQQKIEDYKNLIKRYKSFHKKALEGVVISDTWGLEFLNSKEEKEEEKQEEKKVEKKVEKEKESDNESVKSLSEAEKIEYERMRKRYSQLYPEEQALPEKPSPLTYDPPEPTEPPRLPIISNTKTKVKPRVVLK